MPFRFGGLRARALRAGLLAAVLMAVRVPQCPADDDFAGTVAPILVSRCLECHNPTEKAGGLDLSNRASLLRGGESGAAAVPGEPEDSFLLQRVQDGEMPPPKQGKSRTLPRAEVEALRGWIARGAAWPDGRTLDLFETTTASRGGRDWWSFRPISRPEVPTAKHPGANAIDAFLRAPLDQSGWTSAPPSERRALIRRVYIDLVGYPPPYAEVGAFETDSSPAAYERLIDRLLASPHYGERWGRHWLDVARYAETCGYERDQEKPNAWKYRDWVIRAFNEDKPFDRFVLEQLAGDELADHDPSTVVATGFLRLGTWNDEPNDAEEYKYERLEDMVHATSTAFLGLTVKCARCHDHKFDPIRQTDYYRVAAAFWAGPIEPGPRELLGGPRPDELGPDVLGWTDRGREAPPLRLLRKGDPKRPAQVVEPGPLSAVPALDRPIEPPAEGVKTTGRRRQLAEWIVDPANPLTARVWVNRIWQHHFGQGLVRSSDNFGFTGDRPTHPELLDWLATELLSHGWSTKHLHRLILRSETYRQSSVHPAQADYAAVDPGNRLWWRAERRRLDAESLRDALLTTSGELDRTVMGGPSFRPVIASEALEGLSMKGDAWKASPPEQQRRRSVYLYTKRGLLPPLSTAFDFMDTTLPCGQRDVTLVPPQALALLNNAFVHERSRGLARSLRRAPGGRPEQIEQAWKRILGRRPTPEEAQHALAHVQQQEARFARLLEERERAPNATGPLTEGLVLHLAADRGIERDDQRRVFRWADQSPQRHDASQDLPSARPAFLGTPGDSRPPRLNFDGKGTFLQLPGQVLTSPQFSLFAVATDRGRTGHRTLFSNWNGTAGNSTTSVFIGLTGDGAVRLSDDFSAARQTDPRASLFLLAAVAGARETTIYEGDRVLASKGGPLSARTLNTPFVIGQQGNIQGEWWDGELAELLVYDRALTEEERTRVTAYLSARHGLASAEATDAATLALASLCHVLLNANEFLYVD